MGLRVFVLSFLALLVAYFDTTNVTFHQWRLQLEGVVAPIRWIVNTPIHWVHQTSEMVSLQQALIEENSHLRAKQVLLQSKIQAMLALQRENQQLKALLQSSAMKTGQVKMAQLLAVSLEPSLHQLILDHGQRDGVFVGQPVMDAYGVLGQVVDVSPHTSKVLLLTDQKSAIPVQNYRTGMRAMLSGEGNNHTLSLMDIGIQADIKPGDLFVTSGYGQRFPVGYPIGVVRAVERPKTNKFLVVTLLPTAHLDETQRVLLVWPGRMKLRHEVEQLLARPLPVSGGQ